MSAMSPVGDFGAVLVGHVRHGSTLNNQLLNKYILEQIQSKKVGGANNPA
jgi:hypothetical protein